MRLFLAVLLRALILPQTSFDNLVVRRFNDSGLFANYAEAKQVVTWATWGCLAAFLLLHLWLAVSLVSRSGEETFRAAASKASPFQRKGAGPWTVKK